MPLKLVLGCMQFVALSINSHEQIEPPILLFSIFIGLLYTA